MRVAVLSDIHANLVALDALLAAAGEVDAVWHLGDVVGYGPDPNGVVRRLRDVDAVGVRGNHDAAAVGGPEIEWFNPDARRAMEWTRERLEPEVRQWLVQLPERRTEAGVELVHGSPREPLWEYVTTPAIARRSLERQAAALGLHGHTHVPVAWLETGDDVELLRRGHADDLELAGRRALVNPGSVGQPRDGDPTASFLLLDAEVGRMEWRRAPYDVAAVQATMRSVRLPEFLVDRLARGV
ncbi:MAG TPA: metallophosphoesterase family protein [Candidatus Binatus sp.]|nr:metallophosphoesterase family protein [Candidatus Binatus sp.]